MFCEPPFIFPPSSLLLPLSTGTFNGCDLSVAQGEHAVHSEVPQEGSHQCRPYRHKQTDPEGSVLDTFTGVVYHISSVGCLVCVRMTLSLAAAGCGKSKGTHWRAGSTGCRGCRGDIRSGGILKGACVCILIRSIYTSIDDVINDT